MSREIIIANGALGTALMSRGIRPADVSQVSVSAPQLLTDLYNEYLSSGSTLLTTNTISLNGRPAECVLQCQHAVTTAIATGAITAASIGPTATDAQICAMLPAMTACDYLLIETSVSAKRSTEMATLIRRLYPDARLIVSATAAGDRHMPDGTAVDDWAHRMQAFAPAAIGLNCGMDSAPMCHAILHVADAVDAPIYFAPSAGTPTRAEAPAVWATNVAQAISSMADRDIIAGGCCNTTPAHIAALCLLLKS